MDNKDLRAFHGDPSIKAKYIERVRAHRAAERLTQGIGWDDSNPGQVRGCAVGCTLESYDHSRYPVELGLPEWLARLEDRIFEGLPASEAQAWPESFLEAIKPGVNIEMVRHKLAIRRMDRLIALQSVNFKKHGDSIDAVIMQTIAALAQVRQCHEAEMGGNVCDMPSAESAAAAARSAAAWSAESAAAWAAESAAASAADSVRSAAWSAASAAESAAASARSAARSAESAAESAWIKEAADLLDLLREVTL